MMQKAFFETCDVGLNHRIEIDVPVELGRRVKLIILPDNETEVSEESHAQMMVQEKTGFAQTVLANPAEDVWNDL